MEGAVHRLEVVVLAGLGDVATVVGHLIEVHGRIHPVGVPVEVAGDLEQLRLGDVGAVDELVALLDVPAPRVVLHLLAEHAALGVENRQAGADLVGEAVEVELATEPAVVTPLGFLEVVQVLLEGLLGLPCGAVDPLELPVLLVTAPVRRRAAHQLEGRDPLRGRQVRAAAQVAPRHVALAVDVVVDGELAGSHLDARALRRNLGLARALEADQLDLVGLVLELVDRLGVGDRAPREPLVLLDDLAHPGLDLLEVLRMEGHLDVEVVVEAVLDRRPDPQLRVGVEVLDRLGEHVRGRVAQDVAAVLAVDGHALDHVAVGELVGEVAQVAGDPRGHDRGVVLEELPGLGTRRHGPLLTLTGVDEGDLDVGHGTAPCSCRVSGCGRTRSIVSADLGGVRGSFGRRP